MKNVRIFLTVLLIMALFAFVGCGNDGVAPYYDENKTENGIIDDTERAIDKTEDQIRDSVTTNNAIDNNNQ